MSRQGLWWNFDDDNFTWGDCSVVVDNALSDVRCMRYGFEPGFSARWDDLWTYATTWEDLKNGADPWGIKAGSAETKWPDFYEPAKDQNFYWLTDEGVWTSDQVVDTSGVKKYFAERKGLDFTDVGIQTNDSYKHVRQIMPLLQSADVGAMNTYEFKIGWTNTLMDDTNYSETRTIYLNKTKYAGKHKIDLRSTGRYMAWYWDFTYTDELVMTGADIDLEVSHGR